MEGCEPPCVDGEDEQWRCDGFAEDEDAHTDGAAVEGGEYAGRSSGDQWLVEAGWSRGLVRLWGLCLVWDMGLQEVCPEHEEGDTSGAEQGSAGASCECAVGVDWGEECGVVVTRVEGFGGDGWGEEKRVDRSAEDTGLVATVLVVAVMEEISRDDPVGVGVTEAKCGAVCIALLLPEGCCTESHRQGEDKHEQAGFGQWGAEQGI